MTPKTNEPQTTPNGVAPPSSEKTLLKIMAYYINAARYWKSQCAMNAIIEPRIENNSAYYPIRTHVPLIYTNP